jgi:predicted small metal-binding protein
MREFACRSLGYNCGWKHVARTEERLTDVVAIHLRDVHEVAELAQDMVGRIKHAFTNGERVELAEEDEEPIMKEFKCSDLGMKCGFRYIAQTEDLIIDGVALHERDAHGITEFTPELKLKVANSVHVWKG